jgi:hypothetical protein
MVGRDDRLKHRTISLTGSLSPHAHGRALYHLVQLSEAAQESKGSFAYYGIWIERHTLVNDGMAEMIDADLPKQGKRGPHKKKAA